MTLVGLVGCRMNVEPLQQVSSAKEAYQCPGISPTCREKSYIERSWEGESKYRERESIVSNCPIL